MDKIKESSEVKTGINYYNAYVLCREATKRIFHDCILIYSGFAMQQVTVKFDTPNKNMDVTFFELSGKMNTGIYKIPETKEQLLTTLKNHCGESFINKLLRQRYEKVK